MADVFAGLICRPPRKEYKIEELGPAHFSLGDKECCRKDFELINPLGVKIQCSHYIPLTSVPVPCVVYLHGNSGSRVDADDLVDSFLLEDISMLSLDFSGCGMSDGEYVTLGIRERHDLEAALDYLKAHEKVSKIALYGRSMGAATALLVAADKKYAGLISCMVLDSVYSSIRRVLHELAGKYVGKVPLIPWEGMIAPAVDLLRGVVRSKAGFDFDDLKLMDASRQCKAPALFGHAGGDELVFPSHTRDVHAEYGGPTMLDVFDGDHNSVRPAAFARRAVEHVKLHTRSARGQGGGGLFPATSWLGSLGLRIAATGKEIGGTVAASAHCTDSAKTRGGVKGAASPHHHACAPSTPPPQPPSPAKLDESCSTTVPGDKTDHNPPKVNAVESAVSSPERGEEKSCLCSAENGQVGDSQCGAGAYMRVTWCAVFLVGPAVATLLLAEVTSKWYEGWSEPAWWSFVG